MVDKAYAIFICDENEQAILSEAGTSFDKGLLSAWRRHIEGGYFVRDPDSPLDCCLFEDKEFQQLYFFTTPLDGPLFREITRKE